MKTRVINVNSVGGGIDEALFQADLVAKAYHLSEKDSIHMRLLSEELMGMLRSITGEMSADFWVEEEGGRFALHLLTRTRMNFDKRTELLKASTTGKNAAAKGFMSKIRNMVEYWTMPESDGVPGMMSLGFTDMANPGSFWLAADSADWTMKAYLAGVEARMKSDEQASEEWDELEKSIVAKLADDVSVGISGGNVEMIIYKTFSA
ncbi:MAG: hypothetical protein IKR08_00025 [Firmicutes bacterium]|nr:hypothetical protein [Bacillota bacterium]